MKNNSKKITFFFAPLSTHISGCVAFAFFSLVNVGIILNGAELLIQILVPIVTALVAFSVVLFFLKYASVNLKKGILCTRLTHRLEKTENGVPYLKTNLIGKKFVIDLEKHPLKEVVVTTDPLTTKFLLLFRCEGEELSVPAMNFVTVAYGKFYNSQRKRVMRFAAKCNQLLAKNNIDHGQVAPQREKAASVENKDE